jgi:glutamate racemase
VLRCGFDALVQEWHVVCVDGESVVGGFRDRSQVQAKATVLGCNRFLALAQSFDQVTQVDVQVSGTAYARAHSVERFLQVLWQRVFQRRWQSASNEFFLHGDGSLLAPNGEFL